MSLQPGTEFAGFGIERLLGAGGMGTVYLAAHPRLQRRVALKVLADTFTVDAKARTAFEREATLAAGLDHPNIVPVYDRSAVDDPALWLAMRYIDGGDAAGLLHANPAGLEPARAMRLLADAAHALDYAHGRGVLHRDVKPANLLIANDHRDGERAVLTDFGIARTLDDTVTLSGIAATFAYAAPERFADAPADHRADIYSLGCTLFQLLTGQQPFARKDQAAVIAAHLTAPPPSPRTLRPDLPAELDAVIATALAKSPQDRFPTCTALAEAAARTLHAAAVTVRAEPARPIPVSSGPIPDSSEPVPNSNEPVPNSRELVPSTPARDEAAIPTVVRDPEPPREPPLLVKRDPTLVKRDPPPLPVDVAERIDGRLPHPPAPAESKAAAGVPARRRRVAVVSGLLLTGIGVVVGATFAVRGNSESPATTSPTTVSSTTTASSAGVSQPVTSTTAPGPSIAPVTSAPPPADNPPANDTPPAEEYTTPAGQPQQPVYTQPYTPPPVQAPAVVPQTRVHQFPG
ncbi:protein kinase [Nocardia sp. NPDC127526]|uniref:serine/threonine-protein kinase n=1 Tax=Nocardia sp. NPDC127526 TaxID=3345393 RepID=UPI0036355FA6